MARIQCFMVEVLDVVDVVLRRATFMEPLKPCEVHPYGYHDAQVVIGQQKALRCEEGYLEAMQTSRGDERWPKACMCGYTFLEEDYWQTSQIERYRRLDTGEELAGPQHRLPAGAMWYANSNWPFYYPAEDDRVLACMTPGGEWIIDGRANNGPRDAAGWKREGVPPVVTATPSIQCGPYHGWLKAGFLEEC